MTETEQTQQDLIQQLCDDQLHNEREIRESEQRTFQLRLRQAELRQLLADYQRRRLEALKLAHAQDRIAELELKLIDADISDRRPKHYGYSFNTYDSEEAVFIRNYLSRTREEAPDAQG